MFSCKKVTTTSLDPTRNYFPINLHKSVIYDVDSIYYYGAAGTRYEIKCQMKYAIDDTVTYNNQLSYIMDVFTRPYESAPWVGSSVILITPTPTGILYYQDRTKYLKMTFPVAQGTTWKGNQYAEINDSAFSYLKDWNYTYQNYHLAYTNGLTTYDNTVTVLEDDQNVNYQNVDSAVAGYRTYAKEVYAYDVGMIYKEWTHYTFNANDTFQNKNGYTVIMKAVSYN